MRCRKLEHRFVHFVPERLEPGVLYISLEFCTASHSCCCGCGEEVVTPLSPAQWRMTFDGESVSLWPSVGSWTLRCRSHYVVERGNVRIAPQWSEAEVEAGRQRDRAALERHYETPAAPPAPPVPPPVAPAPHEAKTGNWWVRLWRWFVGG